ncbi:3-hydroxyacyl-CoA dehydrogenase family protein [Billgrantia lactosivorans]|uniref:3-hydroxyacyl-CoA dehydrogenase family protein n=1 Tax=Billgrantia lactosivorans TaxID=2185141 RepID=UPI000DABC8B5|nr:3-hydroxyacyl-CoA dehydrogenase family protein [Halomonas lactosivorans]
MATTIPVCVVGAGLMGHGIAQAFAQSGHAVVLHDSRPEVLETAPRRIRENLEQMGVDAGPVMANLEVCADLARAASSSSLVIEAVPEILELKQELFGDLARVSPSDAILASNTSVIPITRIGERLPDAARARLVGMHWWNPPHLIPLVEVIKTECSREDVFEAAFDLLLAMGKKPVKVFHEVPGFIGNRLQHAMWREALHLVAEGVCTPEAIDEVVKHGFGKRLPYLGPMENADLVGLALTRQVHRLLFPHLCRDPVPSPVLETLIEQGNTGMESGKGLRAWSSSEAENLRHELNRRLLEAD